MAESQPILVGQIVAGMYRIESLLGRGGMGAVYAAAHLRLPTRCAIKFLRTEGAANPEVFARFRREAEITSALRHPNIVQVLDFNRLADGTPYLVMECLEGEDLQARLRRCRRLPFPEVLQLTRAICAGLSAAHRREVVHRDLKPQNIFLCRHEQGDEVIELPKIVDFGISKIRHADADSQRTRDEQLLGTPHYMSPEQAQGNNSNVDHRTDQWALAAIVYQCLTGRLPFRGDSVPAVMYQVVYGEVPAVRSQAPDVPEYAEEAIHRALSKDRDARYPSILDFMRALSGQANTSTVEIPRVGQRRLLILGLGAALVSVALGVHWISLTTSPAAGYPRPPEGETRGPGPGRPAPVPDGGAPAGVGRDAGPGASPDAGPNAGDAGTPRPGLSAPPRPPVLPRAKRPRRPPRINQPSDADTVDLSGVK